MTAEKALLLMSDIIKILVGAIKEYATGIGEGLSALVQSVFLVTSGEGASATTTLSVFGIVILVKALQLKNVYPLISVTPSGITTSVRELQR